MDRGGGEGFTTCPITQGSLMGSWSVRDRVPR